MQDIRLDQIRIASPCPMKWDDLEGDGPMRHCRQCRLNVYNFSAMTRGQIERVIYDAGAGRVCAALYRRADGTILTRDCTVGLRATKVRAAKALGRIAAVFGLLLTATVALAGLNRPREMNRLRHLEPFATLAERFGQSAVTPPILGAIALPVTPPNGCIEMGEVALPDPGK